MALDVGRLRIGVALSDPLRLTANPTTTLSRTPTSTEISEIARLAGEYEVERILVGRPLRLDGRRSETCDVVEAFVCDLRARLSIPIDWAEERLSSKEAEHVMAELGIPVADRRRRRDEIAAALVLRWYIEENSEAPR